MPKLAGNRFATFRLRGDAAYGCLLDHKICDQVLLHQYLELAIGDYFGARIGEQGMERDENSEYHDEVPKCSFLFHVQ